MWVAVYIAPNHRVAAILKQLLEMEGILVKLREPKSASREDRNVEVTVSELEIEEATEVINNALQRF
ncbi:MAG: glutamate decarboxylase [Bacillota bacterium]